MRGPRLLDITRCFRLGWFRRRASRRRFRHAGQAEGSIAADEAAIQAAKVNLGYTKILSPINGVVGLRQVDPGNIVHASDTTGLLVVTQLQPIAVIFTLPEDQLPEVLKRTRGGSRLAVEAFDRVCTDTPGEWELADGGQPDRHSDRHGKGEGGLRESGWCVISEPVCECTANFAGEAECGGDSGGGSADGGAGKFCLPAEAGTAPAEPSAKQEKNGHDMPLPQLPENQNERTMSRRSR